MSNIDIYIEDNGEARALVEGNTSEGEDFIDAWGGAILEVLDSGRIAIPRDVAAEFTAVAVKAGLKVESA